MRRFLQSVKISTEGPLFHAGLGLRSYVQWTSPIRRFGDLQVHASVKRFLRRQRVYEQWEQQQQLQAQQPEGQPSPPGLALPAGIRPTDLGLPDEFFYTSEADGKTYLAVDRIEPEMLDPDINYLEGVGLLGAAKTLQRQSQQYWLFEYIRRLFVQQPDRWYEAVILGCVDPEKQQYAIYVYALGLEHRYTSPGGPLDPGLKIRLRVDKVTPRHGILAFVRVL